MGKFRLNAALICKGTLFLSSLALLAGCAQSSGIQLQPASENEALPRPKFSAKDLTKGNLWPRYSQIRVFRSEADCRIPNCPLLWHVVVSEDQSPREIAYGALPSFGAMTIVAAEDLKPGEEYILYLDSAKGVPEAGSGSLRFYVDDQGQIKTLPEDSE